MAKEMERGKLEPIYRRLVEAGHKDLAAELREVAAGKSYDGIHRMLEKYSNWKRDAPKALKEVQKLMKEMDRRDLQSNVTLFASINYHLVTLWNFLDVANSSKLIDDKDERLSIRLKSDGFKSLMNQAKEITEALEAARGYATDFLHDLEYSIESLGEAIK